MQILSWNVNGIRAVSKKGFLQWLKKASPDILCIQETKAHPEQLSEELRNPKGYHSFWSSPIKKGYSGVGVYSKINPKECSENLGKQEFDQEGRVLQLDYGKFILFNIYFPNGGAGNKRVPFKMSFYEYFRKKANTLKKQGKNLIICGDVNTAHTEIDLARPKENGKNTGFLPEEREWITKFLNDGYIDTFRHFVKDSGHYSWWDYKTKARERDVGWRLDYVIIVKNLLSKLQNSFIMNDVYGSDHCPVGIDINL